MRVAYLGSRETVGFVVARGFGALPPEEPIVLREATPGVFGSLNGTAAAVLDIPIDLLFRFERASSGESRAFSVAPSIAEPFPILAHRGARLPRRSLRRRAAAAPSPPRVVAGIAALVAVGVIVATVLLVGEEDPGPAGEAQQASDTEVPSGTPGGAPALTERQTPASSNADGPERRRPEGARGRRRQAKRPPSRALGTPTAGRLVNGAALPAEGRHFFTWNISKARSPNERFRRFATRGVIDRVRSEIAAYARAHPDAPRVGLGDLSLPEGGEFGLEFGGTGHVAHQNGLEVDVLYPREDGKERAVESLGQVDRPLAQDLLARFVRAGAVLIALEPELGLRGPSKVLDPRDFHEEHLHVRLPKP